MLTNATAKQLEQAAAYNYREMVCLEAIACGGEVREKNGLVWTYAGPDTNANIPFPSPSAMHTGESLNAMMDYYRQHPPKGAGYWSLDPPRPADIGIQLLARGFQPGWRPCWMALDLAAIQDQHAAPGKLQVRGDDDTDIRSITALPFSAGNHVLSPACRQANPGRSQRFLALLQGKVVGQSAVFYTTGDYGVAGIYNVGVVPKMRNQGIGKAVTLAACLYAKEQGYRYAVLNASPEGRRIYEQLGFQWMGDGLTWWLAGDRYITHPPSPLQVALAEATGRGDVAALDRLGPSLMPVDITAPLANNMTLMELAAHCRQPASAEWLIARGAPYTLLDAWDLGWRDRAAQLLAANPQEVNRQYCEGNMTILHIAVQRNDTALAELALSAKPDVRLKDSWHNSTPLGWAQFFQRPELIALIKAHGG